MKPKGAGYSDENAHRIAYLISGYIRKTLTEAEHDELDSWVEASDENMRLFEELTDENNILANLSWMDQVQTEKALFKAKENLQFNKRPKHQPLGKWVYYLVAASLIIAVCTIAFLLKKEIPGKTDLVAADLAPGQNKAILHLANGKKISLDDAVKGRIGEENGTVIQKNQEGEIMYAGHSNQGELAYNTLTTPRGGQFSIQLSDGTRVWLNAQSSLTYPVQFNDTQRLVKLEGEAFFEVSKDQAKPFIVQLKGEESVKVLGTRFNVSAYGDDTSRKVTLAVGSVEVNAARQKVKLLPGQQAIFEKMKIKVDNHADVEMATAWKNGEFIFRNASIYDMMKQVERWYDVDVIYKTTVSENFHISIARNQSLSKLLHLLELTGRIHFKLENKTLYVLP